MVHPFRIAALVVLGVVVQVAVFPHLRAFGVVPEVGLVLAVAIAFRYGPEAGALTGFAAGFAYDLFLETPLGLSALAYALTAHFVGVVQAGMLRAPRWMPVFLGALGGAVGATTFAGVGILVGVDALRTGRTLGVIAVGALYAAVIAPFVFGLVNVVLGRDREPMTGWR